MSLSRYILYSSKICPFSKKVRFFMYDNQISFEESEINFWERSKNMLRLNPACETPVLKDTEKGLIINDSFLICEYLRQEQPQDNELEYSNLFGMNDKETYEIQRLHMWFDKKFFNEITNNIIYEIFIKTFNKDDKNINKNVIDASLINLEQHIKYIEHLLIKRSYLAGEYFSIADMAAATQISILDYLGYIQWNNYSKFKDWYIKIKQKKSFSKILDDKIVGFNPNPMYKQLDF